MVKYSRRHLTFPCDKLPAVQGLANAMPCPPGITYVAGHWQGYRTIESLLWRPEPSAQGYGEAAGIVAPSWSWASVKGPVAEVEMYDAHEGKISLATLQRSETCNTATIPQAAATAGPRLLMSAAVYSLGEVSTDLLLYRKPRQHDESTIALKTAWLPGELLQPPSTERHTVSDPWGSGDERPWVDICFDNHQASLFESLNPFSSQDASSTVEWHTISLNDGRTPIIISLFTMEKFHDFAGGRELGCLGFKVIGLLLKQIGEEEGRPVCERVGRVRLELRLQAHVDAVELVKGMAQREFYLV